MRNFGTLIIITGIFFNLACQSGDGFVEATVDVNAVETATVHEDDSVVPATIEPATEITMEAVPRTPAETLDAVPMMPVTEITMEQTARQPVEVVQVAELTATKTAPQTATITPSTNYENQKNYETHVDLKPAPRREHATKDDLIVAERQEPTDDD